MFQQFESVKIRALIGACGQESHDVAQLLTPYTSADQARRRYNDRPQYVPQRVAAST